MDKKQMLYPKLARTIRKLRAEHSMTQKQFAEKLRITQASVSLYENGARMPEHKQLEKIADYFNVTISYLLGEEQPQSSSPTLLHRNPNPRYLPVLGTVAAGGLETPVQLTDEDVEVPASIDCDLNSLLAIKCNGDSMNKIIPDGYTLIVKKATDSILRDGDIVVFRKENEYSVKRFYDMQDIIVFKPESYSDEFKSIVVPKDSDDQVEIIGKVVYACSKFE